MTADSRRHGWRRILFQTLSISAGAILLCAILLVGSKAAWSQTDADDAPPAKAANEDEPQNPFPNRFDAPPLTGGLGWINSSGPIDLKKLQGKIVLLDFWTYCCINCMHVLPDLAKLEEEFPNELVVIGIHSAKFDGEQDSQNIRDAVMRYEIKHPVINDGKMTIWRRFGTNSWPTLALIDPEGKFVGRVSGEGNYEVLRNAIERLITYHEKKGTLDRTPLHFELESAHREPTPLLYPGKVAVDPDGKRLFVADSGHHRIVIVDPTTSEVIQVMGTGSPGLVDGSLDVAQFDEPQGMAIDGDVVYVADRRNHVIRKIDLAAGQVSTIAGTGKQGHERVRSGPATEIPLGSPWDVLLHGNSLYIAMAGTHQIWRLDLKQNQIGPFAGSGRETITDGSPIEAAFAQPSGFATDGKWLYVADSETSSVRKVDLATGDTDSVVGQGLFVFGDVDGKGDEVRLQHALGLAWDGKQLFVADTYNNKIKTLNPATREAATFVGNGKTPLSDDPPQFDEPAGLALAGKTLYVADTNNHAIRAVDLGSKKVTTLHFQGLEAPVVQDEPVEMEDVSVIEVEPATLAKGKEIQVQTTIQVPDGTKLNPNAPMSFRVRKSTADGAKSVIQRGRAETIAPQTTFTIPAKDLADAQSVEISLTYFPCEVGSEGVCRIETATWSIPIQFADSGTESISLKVPDNQ